MLPSSRQDTMRENYFSFIKGVRDWYLGRNWQLDMNAKFENQSFRQKGHNQESPASFISRCIMYTKMLVNVDDGGPIEVYTVMKNAPVGWGPIIGLDTINDSAMLYAKVTEHEKALVSVFRAQSSNVITMDTLASSLRDLGMTPSRARRPWNRQVNITESSSNEDLENSSPVENPDSPQVNEILEDNTSVVAQAFAILQR